MKTGNITKRSEEWIWIQHLIASMKEKGKCGILFLKTTLINDRYAKLRKLIGSPNVLFPVGEEGGRLRSVTEACNVGTIKAEFPLFYCEKCDICLNIAWLKWICGCRQAIRSPMSSFVPLKTSYKDSGSL